jgi:hypothetical protein
MSRGKLRSPQIQASKQAIQMGLSSHQDRSKQSLLFGHLSMKRSSCESTRQRRLSLVDMKIEAMLESGLDLYHARLK